MTTLNTLLDADKSVFPKLYLDNELFDEPTEHYEHSSYLAFNFIPDDYDETDRLNYKVDYMLQ